VETLPRWCLVPTQTLVSDVALLGSELDELINRVLVTALGSLLQHG
jgi:hypothetical protein